MRSYEVPGFSCFRSLDTTVWIRSDLADIEPLKELLLKPQLLYQRVVIEEGNDDKRGVVHAFSLPGVFSKKRLVLKRYWRGGLYGRIAPSGYLSLRRYMRELQVVAYAQQNKVPVPRVVALCVQKRGWFYEGYLVSEEVGNSRNLAHVAIAMGKGKALLKGGQPGDTRLKQRMIKVSARAVALMHKVGLFHEDLNLNNILVQGRGDGVRPYILDMGYSTIRGEFDGQSALKNLVRLNRACEKLNLKSPRIGMKDKMRFLSYYFGSRKKAFNHVRHFRKRYEVNYRLHNVTWMVRGFKKIPLFSKLSAYLLPWLIRMIYRLPRFLAVLLAYVLGVIAYVVDFKHRRIARRNVRLAFGNVFSSLQRGRIVRKSFINLALNCIEFIRIPSYRDRDLSVLFHIEGGHFLKRAQLKGKGIVFVVPHMGNWELLGYVSKMFKINVFAVGQRIENSYLDAFVRSTREKTGLRLLPKRNIVREVCRILRSNDSVAILADQRVRDNSVPVRFFGKITRATVSPVVFSLKTGAPIVPAYIVRTAPFRHKVVFGPPIEVSSEGRRIADAVQQGTELIVQRMENIIKRYPPQWFWVHDRWKKT